MRESPPEELQEHHQSYYNVALTIYKAVIDDNADEPLKIQWKHS